jgi:hypothetical protein
MRKNHPDQQNRIQEEEEEQQQQLQQHREQIKDPPDASLPSSSTNGTKNQKSSFRCSHCKDHFNGRRSLYLHQKIQHGRGEELQESPYSENDAPGIDPTTHRLSDRHLKEVYDANREHILKSNDYGNEEKMTRSYNFPTSDLQEGAEDELYGHAKRILGDIKSSFKLNLSFGYVLKDTN